VALTFNGKTLAVRESYEDKSHASGLTVFIDDVLLESKKLISDIDAVAVGKGPGSYTGLRIGVSTAKGICYGSQKPLIAVGTLDILIRQAKLTGWENNNNSLPTLFCPMIDARRMEVFTCIQDENGKMIEPVQARIIDRNSFDHYLSDHFILFFGSGTNKCKAFLDHPHAVFLPDIFPGSAALGTIAEEKYMNSDFEDIAYFEPFYLKEFVLNPAYINSSLWSSFFGYLVTFVIPHDYVYLWHYIPWNENKIIRTLKKEYDWEGDSETGLTWRIDDGSPAFYNYVYCFRLRQILFTR
jgi:tRNA threonylcarbamoyladenosine biosynthesis protein TsaB